MSKLLLRRGLSSQTPLLDVGELGIDTDTFTVRVGNGTSNAGRALIEGSTATYDLTSIPQLTLGLTSASVQVPGTSAIRPLTEFFGDAVSCRAFGVVGDGSTDDTNALLAWASYCSVNQKVAYVPPGLIIVFYRTLHFSELCRGLHMEGSVFVYRGSQFNQALKFGSDTVEGNNVRYSGVNLVNYNQADFNNQGSIGVEIENIDNSEFVFNRIKGFTIALNLNANGNTVSYNRISLLNATNNQADVRFEVFNAGRIDGNVFPVVNSSIDDGIQPNFARYCFDLIEDGNAANTCVGNRATIDYAKKEVQDWTPYTYYPAGAAWESYCRRVSRIFHAVQSGASGLDGPITAGQLQTDNGVQWFYLGSDVNSIPVVLNPLMKRNSFELLLRNRLKYAYRCLTGPNASADAPEENVVTVLQSLDNTFDVDDASSFQTNKLIRPVDRIFAGLDRTLFFRSNLRQYTSRTGTTSTNITVNGVSFVNTTPPVGSQASQNISQTLSPISDAHVGQTTVHMPPANAIGALFRVTLNDSVISVEAEIQPPSYTEGASYGVGQHVTPTTPNGNTYKVVAVNVGGTWDYHTKTLGRCGPEPEWCDRAHHYKFCTSGSLMFQMVISITTTTTTLPTPTPTPTPDSPPPPVSFSDCYTIAIPFDYGGAPITRTPYPIAMVVGTDTGEVQIRLSNPSSLSHGDKVHVSGITGVPNVNGYWSINLFDAQTMVLRGSTFTGAYSGGGSVTLVPITFRDVPIYLPDVQGYRNPLQFQGWDVITTSASVSYVFLGIVSSTTPLALSSLTYKTDRTSRVEYQDYYGTQDDNPSATSIDNPGNLCAQLTTIELGTKISYVPDDPRAYTSGCPAYLICTGQGTGSSNYGCTGTVTPGSPIFTLNSYIGLTPGKIFWDVVSAASGKKYCQRKRHLNYNANGDCHIIFPNNFSDYDTQAILSMSVSLCTGLAGGSTFTVDAVLNLEVGQYIDVANACSGARIIGIRGLVIMIDQVLRTNCTGVPCTWHQPSFDNTSAIAQINPILRIAGSAQTGSQLSSSAVYDITKAPTHSSGDAVLSATVIPSFTDSDHYINVNVPLRGITTNHPQAAADIGIAVWEQVSQTLVDFSTARLTVSETTGLNAISNSINLACKYRPGTIQPVVYEVRVGLISASTAPPTLSINYGTFGPYAATGIVNVSKMTMYVLEDNHTEARTNIPIVITPTPAPSPTPVPSPAPTPSPTPTPTPPIVAQWSTTDKTTGISLASDSLTVTTTVAGPQTVRSVNAFSTGKVFFEVTATTIKSSFSVGVANQTFPLLAPNGLGSDNNGVGYFPVNPVQTVYINGVQYFTGGLSDTNGATISIALDLVNHLVWFTSSAMRSSGYTWNNSRTADPSLGVGGINITTMASGPYFATFNCRDVGAVAKANFGASPFSITMPSGFMAWNGTTGQVAGPTPTPAPAPSPTPAPTPQPAPTPTPQPSPTPQPAPTPTPTPAGGTSASGTTLTTTTGVIIDNAGNRWTLVSGSYGLQVYKNGQPAGFTSNVQLLLWFNNNIYHENTSNNWYQWPATGSSWISLASDPRSITPTPQPTGATWSPTDKSSTITLSNGNRTAASNTNVPQSVRSTNAFSIGKYYFEVVANAITNDFAIGIANAAFSLNNSGGIGADNNAVGYYPVSPVQSIYIGNHQYTIGSVSDVSGAVLSCAVDLTNRLIWFSSPAMRAAGYTWNNSHTASPASGTGGISLAPMATGPYYAIWNNVEGNSRATANFQSADFVNTSLVPLGFGPWGGTATPASPDGTSLTGLIGSIVDIVGNVWNLISDVTRGLLPSINSTQAGTPPTTASTAQLLWFNGTVYQQTANNQWFKWSSANNWLAVAGDPRTTGTPSPTVTPTTWNPADKSAFLTLSNNNLTALSVNAIAQGVRSTTSRSQSKVYFEVTANTLTRDFGVGISTARYSMIFPLGLINDSVGYNPVQPPQTLTLNSQQMFSGGVADASGAVVSIAVDFGKKLIWVTSPAMRASGYAWNNSASANPSTGAGGVSIAGLATGPYYATVFDDRGGATATANFGANAFSQPLPSGFVSWNNGS